MAKTVSHGQSLGFFSDNVVAIFCLAQDLLILYFVNQIYMKVFWCVNKKTDKSTAGNPFTAYAYAKFSIDT
jgi:hypothetical protein